MREKELRLALVCYGGVSLAVYMHGITKEVWRLARASRSFHDDADPVSGTDAVYHALLAEMQEGSGLRVWVLADIVAGASAGGINGIFLAQAIATGQSLDPLTDLWLASADVEALIDPEAAPSSRFSKMWAVPIAWAAGRGAMEGLDDATRDEVRGKLSHLIRSRWFQPPFAGDAFTGLLLDALDAMTASPRGPRLLPAGQPLDLFVTVTDFTGHPERLRLNSPPEVVETEHRVVVHFTDSGEPADTLAALPELAFAARATSSFPGAFPPFTVGELDGVLKQRRKGWSGRKGFLSRVLPRHSATGAADKAVLIDGSVLANAPFRPAIEALRQRPAKRQVDRRFVYIDPSPSNKLRLRARGEQPGWFQTILGALSDLPRQQPIRDNLEAIAVRSGRTERLRGIVATLRPAVEAEVAALFGDELDTARLTPARLMAWRRRAHAAAVDHAGYAHAAYSHLKVLGVVDALAELLAEVGRRSAESLAPSLHAALPGIGEDADATVAFLRGFDLRYRIRRLRLLARRLADLEGGADEATLAPARDAIYAALARYGDRQRAQAHAALRPLLRPKRPDWPALFDTLFDTLDLSTLDAETDAALSRALASLPAETRQPLLLAWLGFPWFDVATLPLLGGEGLDEFDPIKVDRIAPDDATSIRGGGAEATLKGIQFNNFGAFFSRAYRENDYLWGRLHGAERLIDITISTAPTRLRPGRVAALKRRIFRAILDAEEPRLTAIGPLIASLREEIG